jgi:hypothetical protein
MPRQVLCLQVLEEEIVYVFLGHLPSFLENRRYLICQRRGGANSIPILRSVRTLHLLCLMIYICLGS